MEKNKQSSVEWLYQEHSKLLIQILSKKISLDQARVDYDALFLKAKHLHKLEIMGAYFTGKVDETGYVELYYEETYNNENNL